MAGISSTRVTSCCKTKPSLNLSWVRLAVRCQTGLACAFSARSMDFCRPLGLSHLLPLELLFPGTQPGAFQCGLMISLVVVIALTIFLFYATEILGLCDIFL